MDLPSTNSPATREAQRVHRTRSLPSGRPFRVAVFFAAIHYLGLIAAVTALACIMHERNQLASRILVGGLALSAVTWFIALFRRRSALCPLCKGTPLINSGARAHPRARRIFPFNHGVSACLSVLATQRFRCMYCGSDFDLLKPPTRLFEGTPGGESTAAHDSRA